MTKKETMINFLKKYGFLCASIFCFIFSVCAVWTKMPFQYLYFILMAVCSLFFDSNKIIVLGSFSLTFDQTFHIPHVLTPLAIGLLVRILKLLIVDKQKLKKEMIVPIVILGYFIVIFFCAGYQGDFLSIFNSTLIVSIMVMLFYLRKEIDFNFIVKGYLFSFLASILTSLLFFIIPNDVPLVHIDDEGIHRFMALMNHEVTLAIWVVVLLACNITRYFKRNIGFVPFLFEDALLIVVGIATKSKTFLILFVIMLCLYIVKVFINNKKSGFIQTAVVLVGVIVLCAIFNKKVIEIFTRFTAYCKGSDLLDVISTGRLSIWRRSIKIWINDVRSILFGLGASYVYPNWPHPHNSYLDFLFRYGVIGLIPLIVGLVYVFKKISKKPVYKIENFIPLLVVLMMMFIENFHCGNVVLLVIAVLAVYHDEKKTEKTNVLYYNGSLSMGGTDRYMLDIVGGCDKNEFSFDLLIKTKENLSEVFFEEAQHYSNKIVFLGKNLISQIFNATKYFIKNCGRYDVFHINATSGSVGIFSFLAKGFGGTKKIIFHSHMGGNDHKKTVVDEVGILLAKICSNTLVACSLVASEYMFGKKKTNENKVFILNNSVDCDKFEFSIQEREKMRENLNLKDKFVILNVGRMAPQKNHKKLIEVFNTLSKQDENAVLVLVGEGELEKEIKNLTALYSLNEKVVFLGNRSDVNLIMQASDVFVMTSIHEGLPIVAVEAQASSLPLVVSENISKETDIVGNATFISLDETNQLWADAIEKYRNCERVSTKKILAEKGFDRPSAIKIVEQLYRG